MKMGNSELLDLLRARGKRLEPGKAYDVLLEHKGTCGLWSGLGRCDCQPEINLKEVKHRNLLRTGKW